MKTRARGLMTSLFLMIACISAGQSHFAQVGDSQITSQSAATSPNDETAPRLWIGFDLQQVNVNAINTKFFGIGGGSAFSGRFQFDILGKEKFGLSGVLGAGVTQLKYDGRVYNNMNNKSFNATEHSLSLTTGLIFSLMNPRGKQEHFDLEVSGMIWFFDRDYWEGPNYLSYGITGEKYMMFLSPMYSRGFEQIRFSAGPFANFLISEKPESYTQSLQYCFGMRMVFGLGL